MDDTSKSFAAHVIPVDIEDEVQSSFIDYAMSVIVMRALPDVRDGLKPVHRRILYAMRDLGLTHNRPHRKSARVVGEVLGKYHPHGDTAVYDSLVRMAQDFSMRYPLTDGHGNFGSVDGDNAAAMRYTEIRLEKLSMELLADIEKETVDMRDNFDGSFQEPSVLPTRVPNLLINGSSGIAVGMATNIPPHNMSEVINGLVHLIDNPEADYEDLMKFIPGPDFPTRGLIYGAEGIKEAYRTGRGKIRVRARAKIEHDKRARIVITELPFMVNKAQLVGKIAELVNQKKLRDVADLRDESDRDGIRVVVDLKMASTPEIVLNQLYKHTTMETTFGMIMLSLVDQRPHVLTLKEMLNYFLEHRREVVRRRTEFDLAKAEARAHVVEGLLIALDNIDRVIEIIKKSENPDAARATLMKEMKLSEIQAQAILQMRLQTLTGLETDKLKEELAELKKIIAELKAILDSAELMDQVIKDELKEIKKKYGDKRRTEIVGEIVEFNLEDLIPNEEMAVIVTRDGYVKRMRLSTYRSQARGGKGVVASKQKEADIVKHLFVSMNHDYMLFFSDRGMVYSLKIYEIPEGTRQSKGRPIINLVDVKTGEKITAMIPVREFPEDRYLVMATCKGIAKKTKLSDYSSVARYKQRGIIGIKLREDDHMLGIHQTDGTSELLLSTKHGRCLKFHENDVRTVGRASIGVIGIRLKDDDEVVDLAMAEPGTSMLTVTEKGYGKRTAVEEYPIRRRGGVGVIDIRTTPRNGMVVGVRSVTDGDQCLLITQNGMVIRILVKSISIISRRTMGVRLIRLNKQDRVVTFEKIEIEKDEVEEDQ